MNATSYSDPIDNRPTYSVVRRSKTSRYLDTGEGEIFGYGGMHKPLVAALIEMEARNLLLHERRHDQWSIEPTPIADDLLGVHFDTQDVYDFLVDVLGIEPAEAERLIEEA